MSKWNGNRFSVYTSDEKSVLGLINEIGKNINTLIDNLDSKTDITGDHKGTWQGLKRPTLSDEGLKSTVEQLIDTTIPSLEKEMEETISETNKIVNDKIKGLINKSAFISQRFIRGKVDYLPEGKSHFGLQGMGTTKRGFIYCVSSGDKSVSPSNSWLIEIDFNGNFLRKVQSSGGHINSICYVESENALYCTYMLSNQNMYLYKLDYNTLSVLKSSSILCCSIGKDKENNRLIVFNDDFKYYYVDYNLNVISEGIVNNTSGLKAYQGGCVYQDYYLALGFGIIYVMNKNNMEYLGNIQLPNYDVNDLHINEWEDIDIDENGDIILFGGIFSNTIDINNIGIGKIPTYNYFYVGIPYWGNLSTSNIIIENGLKEGFVSIKNENDYINAYKQLGNNSHPFKSLIVSSHSRLKQLSLDINYIEEGDGLESENQWLKGTINFAKNFLLKNCYSTDYITLNPTGACVVFDATKLKVRVTKLTDNYCIYSKSNGENFIFSNGGFKANVYVKSSFDSLSNVCCVTESVNSGVIKLTSYYDTFKHTNGAYKLPFPRDYTHGVTSKITIKWQKASSPTIIKNYYFNRDDGKTAYFLTENNQELIVVWNDGLITLTDSTVPSGYYPEMVIYN